MLPMYIPGRFLTGSRPSRTWNDGPKVRLVHAAWDTCSAARSAKQTWCTVHWQSARLYLICSIISLFQDGP